MYEDFFTGDVTVTANLINAGVEATTASFRAPDVYATKGVDGSDMDWTITRFALLGGGRRVRGRAWCSLSPSALAAEWRAREDVILTCYDGAVYANQPSTRIFERRGDGKYFRCAAQGSTAGPFSFDRCCAEQGLNPLPRFENGVLVCRRLPCAMSGRAVMEMLLYDLNGDYPLLRSRWRLCRLKSEANDDCGCRSGRAAQ